MKIGVDIRSLMNSRYSGVAFYAYNLLKELLANDSANDYYLFYNAHGQKTVPFFDYPNVHYCAYQVPNKLFNLGLNLFNYPKLDQLVGGVDKFFMPNWHFVALSNKCQKILTVHDLSFLRYPQFFPLKSRLWHKIILAKRLVNKADKIIAISQNTKNDLVELLKVDPAKITVIYEGVGEQFKLRQRDDEQVQKVKAKYHLPEKFYLCLGTLEPRKNWLSAIDGFLTSHTSANLVLAGGHGWQSAEVLNKAGNNAKIILLDYVEEEDKPYLYNLAEALVYPSFYEGFGLPIVEAMASGCPVIAGANSSQSEIVGEAGLLVNAYRSEEIAQAINLLEQNTNYRQQLIDLGLRRALDFNWRECAEKTKQVITQ